jgi:hypothetical protein
MRTLIEQVRHHVDEEESELFPVIRKSLSAERLNDLGQALEGARMMVPTRPHSNAPTSPLGKLA